MSGQSPISRTSRNTTGKRPPLMSELADEAMRTMVPCTNTHDIKSLKDYLRHAEVYRREGNDCAKSGDFETAFIKLAQAATIILEKIPMHSHYLTFLSATQRHNLYLNGQDILDNMGVLKPTLVALHNEWVLSHSNGINRTTPQMTSAKGSNPSFTNDLENEFLALNIANHLPQSADHLYPRLEPTMTTISEPGQSPSESQKGKSIEIYAHVPPPPQIVKVPPPLYPVLRPPVRVDKEITETTSQVNASSLDGSDVSQLRSIVSPSSKSAMGVMADDLTGFVTRDSEYAAHGGGYADVYKGVLRKNERNTKVAIKVIRAHIYVSTNQWKINKRLNREIRVWSGLRHPNIVPLLGVTQNFGPHVAMVCPWMNEGNLNHYLDNRKAELNLRRRLQILVDVVEGLTYLHQKSIVHGDLTSANVLMDGGKAHLTDFGLSNVTAEIRNASFLTSTVGGAPRWTAPELIVFRSNNAEATTGPTPDLTTHCDIYSFGSVALQVISGKIPYSNIISDFQVLMEIIKGSPPARPVEPILSDPFWGFIVSCLGRDPFTRPEINQVRETLQILRYNCSEEELAANVMDSDTPTSEVKDEGK